MAAASQVLAATVLTMPRGQRAGEGIDTFGGPVIDPTKNVLDLVHAERMRQDGLREAESRRVDERRTAESLRIDQLREAELRRMNDLDAARTKCAEAMEALRSAHLNNSAALLSDQLKEVKKDLEKRMSELEQFRWQYGGRSGLQSQLIAWAIAGAMALFAAATFFLKP